MVQIAYDSTGVDRSKNFDEEYKPPKVGVYPMVVEDVEHQAADGSHPDRIIIKSRMIGADEDGNGKNYGFWNYINYKDKSQDWVLDQWIALTGLDTEGKPKGKFDTNKLKGLKFRGRVRSDSYGGEYRPKLGRVMPMVSGEEDEEGWEDDSQVNTDAGAVDDEQLAGLNDYSEEEIDGLGEAGDQGDEEAINEMVRLSEEVGLDPNDYPTWADLAVALNENRAPEEEPEPEPTPVKASVAKKAAAAPVKAAAKKAAARPAPEPEPAGEDYESWSLEDINAELEARNLPTTGPKSAKITRLRANDEDPFAG